MKAAFDLRGANKPARAFKFLCGTARKRQEVTRPRVHRLRCLVLVSGSASLLAQEPLS